MPTQPISPFLQRMSEAQSFEELLKRMRQENLRVAYLMGWRLQ